MGEEFLEVEPGVGVNRFRRDMGLIQRGVGQIGVEAVGRLGFTIPLMAGTVAVASGAEGVVGRGVMGVMTGMFSSTGMSSMSSMSSMSMAQLVHDEL